MKGLSGYEHQIDVVYRFKIWMTEILVIVECKQYEKKVGVDDLLEFKSRIEDLRAHKGIFVTSSDYQSGAIEFARANRIALLVARGTRHWAVCYSLMAIPIDEQCRSQAEYLRDRFQTGASGLDSRISIDSGRHEVVVAHDGVTVTMPPWELHFSMLYRQPCNFQASETGESFLAREHFECLPMNKLLKSLILDELLTAETNG